MSTSFPQLRQGSQSLSSLVKHSVEPFVSAATLLTVAYFNGSFAGKGSFINIGGGLIINAAYNNNLGNIKLLVAAVPDPEIYAMMLAGLALTGFMARRQD